ncbi:hypothetical protein WJU16_01045 [Chitinophaga pollutisoli]|uniref:Uncharacterized protein n=1 Tax=Chitinophaga pollutisoli TaxID=3133966 RepID=A0ABZ2YQA0_9BACT
MKLILSSLLVLLQLAAFAQFKEIAKSNSFQEPEDGFARIIQMKNGYTVLAVINLKTGIDIKIFDEKHKQKTAKNLRPKLGKIKAGNVEAMFEAKGNVVMLINEVEAKVPVLHRLVIDGVKGTIISEAVIGELKKLNLGQGYAMAFGGVSPPGFYAEKDPNSDQYAVAMFNSFESDRNKRLELVLYDGDHKEIARSYYKSPQDKYKYINFMDMTFVGSTVYCLGYARNTRASGGKENTVVMAELAAGDADMKMTELKFTHDQDLKRGILRYNAATGKIMLLAFAPYKNSNGRGELWLFHMDPKKLDAKKHDEIVPNAIQEKATAVFGSREKFTATPVNMFVYKDGSYTVAMEEIRVVTHTTGGLPTGGTNGVPAGFSRMSSRSYTIVEHLGLMHYDANSDLINSWYLPKDHYMWTAHPPTFYHRQREGRAVLLNDGDQYKTFVLLRSKGKEYVLYNDVEENDKRIAKGKDPQQVKGLKACDAFYFPLEKEMIPARSWLFGESKGRKDHHLALLPVSDFNEDQNLFVTLRLDIHKAKQVHLVWMEP